MLLVCFWCIFEIYNGERIDTEVGNQCWSLDLMLPSLLGKLPDGFVCGATNDSAPLLSPDLCSDPNSVSYCGIKGKFFSGPLFPDF